MCSVSIDIFLILSTGPPPVETVTSGANKHPDGPQTFAAAQKNQNGFFFFFLSSHGCLQPLRFTTQGFRRRFNPPVFPRHHRKWLPLGLASALGAKFQRRTLGSPPFNSSRRSRRHLLFLDAPLSRSLSFSFFSLSFFARSLC